MIPTFEFYTYYERYLLKHLQQMQISNAYMEEKINWHVSLRRGGPSINTSLATAVFVRGGDAKNAARLEHFSDRSMFARYGILACRSFLHHSNSRFYTTYSCVQLGI